MIALVEGAQRQKTPERDRPEHPPGGADAGVPVRGRDAPPFAATAARPIPVPVLVALLVCLIPTTIGALHLRHRHRRDGPPPPAQRAGDVGPRRRGGRDVNRCSWTRPARSPWATARRRSSFPSRRRRAASRRRAQLASLSDETPEGRSIVVLAKQKYGSAARRCERMRRSSPSRAQTRMSGVDFDGRRIRKGAVDSVAECVRGQGGTIDPTVLDLLNRIAAEGATPLAVADGPRVLGVVALRGQSSRPACGTASTACAPWASER